MVNKMVRRNKFRIDLSKTDDGYMAVVYSTVNGRYNEVITIIFDKILKDDDFKTYHLFLGDRNIASIPKNSVFNIDLSK